MPCPEPFRSTLRNNDCLASDVTDRALSVHARKIHDDAVPLACLACFLAAAFALGWSPRSRGVWILENIPTAIAVIATTLTYRRFRFSDRAYVQAATFLLLHSIGSHFTYEHMPTGAALRDLLSLSRNHYDRVVHFAFGALVFLPVRELTFKRRPSTSRVFELYVAFAGIGCASTLYELVEWWVAGVLAPEEGPAFLAIQGDVWDAQKDIALAWAGALLAAIADFPTMGRGSSADVRG
jgi:putative membrane protein